MCRLYGFLATEPTRLECSLVEAQNALVVQSDRDRQGRRNADGWGIAAWHEGLQRAHKNTHPAFADRRFVEVASAVNSHAVIAHVRRATVGRVSHYNTHPFVHGPWAFAHNGTIEPYEHLRTHLDLGRLVPTRGETDSELVFRWLLNRMRDYGLDPTAPAQSPEPLMELLADGLLELVRVSLLAGADEPPQLNFVLSDGRHLAATRWRNTLYWTYRQGLSDCAFCGSSHCPNADDAYRAVVVASEPITDEAWTEIPEATVFGADAEIRTMTRSLATTAATADA